MRIAPIADIKAHLSAYLKESEKGPVVITKNGKPVAVLLGVTDEDEIERLTLAYSPKFQAILAQGRQQIQETGGTAHEEFWREVKAETE
jgi:prevent-host-death family protein